jgi:hypothetical protein
LPPCALPTSTPTLNPTNAKANTPLGSLRSVRTLAKPKPWISPKQKATTQRRLRTIGKRLLSGASTTDMAMADSEMRAGKLTTCNVARLSVIECATVKA